MTTDDTLTPAEITALLLHGWALDGGIESDGVMLLRFRREGVRVQTVAEWRGELTRLEEAVDDAVLANYRAIQASMAQATAQLLALRQENARLRTDRNGAHEIARAARASEAAERVRRERVEADVAWWHATVANYVTSATVADRQLLRATLAEATTYPRPGTALLRELGAARAVVDVVRDVIVHPLVETYGLALLESALSTHDKALEGRAK